jgi:hypothetical protein
MKNTIKENLEAINVALKAKYPKNTISAPGEESEDGYYVFLIDSMKSYWLEEFDRFTEELQEKLGIGVGVPVMFALGKVIEAEGLFEGVKIRNVIGTNFVCGKIESGGFGVHDFIFSSSRYSGVLGGISVGQVKSSALQGFASLEPANALGDHNYELAA